MTSRDAVIACLRDIREQITSAVEGMSADRWTSNVYEGGWNEQQLLYHIASTSGVASFVLAMSKLPKQTGGEPFDNDAFNRDQVALREGRSPAETLDEVRSNIQRDIRAIEKAPDEDLQRMWTAPWGWKGPWRRSSSPRSMATSVRTSMTCATQRGSPLPVDPGAGGAVYLHAEVILQPTHLPEVLEVMLSQPAGDLFHRDGVLVGVLADALPVSLV